MEAVYARFGHEVRRARKKRGMTQDELAARVKLGRTSIVNIERGRQRLHLHTFLAIARALEVGPAELFPDEPRPIPGIADRVEDLPPAARDWVMRVASRSRSRQKDRHARGAKT